MKNVFIISTLKIYKGNGAGAGRLMNISKSLAMSNNKVFLCSAELYDKISVENVKEVFQNIFVVGEEKQISGNRLINKIMKKIGYTLSVTAYLVKINKLLKQIDGEKVIYLYPSNFISMDLMCLIIIKMLNRYHIYYDVNEIRRASLENRPFSPVFLKRILQLIQWCIDLIKYVIVEQMMRFYDGLVVISTHIEKYVVKYNANILRVPILSDTSEKIFSNAPIFINGGKFLICFTGQVVLKKEGFDLLFEALYRVKSKFDSFELHLYGPIRDSEKNLLLNDIPSKYGIKQNVFYHGSVPRENIMEVMQSNHLLILPRPLSMQTKYGFSTKLSEYLVSGIPVLVTDVSDNTLYIKDGFNGFVVQPGNPKSMAEKIIYLIVNYNEIADFVVQNAFETAKKNFYYANYSGQFNNFIN